MSYIIDGGWNTHPRPQLKRELFLSLNGEWKLGDKTINVPYPPESKLSGYEGEVYKELWYERSFRVPEGFTKDRILLHFGAVDQKAKVRVNNKLVGVHIGGYLPFVIDITEVVKKDEDNYLEVIVEDNLDKAHPYGKQTEKPKGMWYTQVSGIWQSVWLENVPDIYVEKLIMTPWVDRVQLKVVCNKEVESCRVKINLPVEISDNSDGEMNCEDNILEVDLEKGEGVIEIPNPINWTPDNPHLYDMKIYVGEDVVSSYFALRTIEIREMDGVRRVCLNGKPIFFHGVLDQGYFEEGIFLPRSEEDYDKDILFMKELGFNMLRKHIKIEPEYFYYACDRLGMLVMQDMVNNGEYSFIRDTALPTMGFKKKNDRKSKADERTKEVFKHHTRGTVEHLYNHPSIVSYTIFNEGWGQFDSDDMYDLVKALDGTRLVDSTSGWFAQNKNDFDSEHIYFRLKKLKVKERPLFITECGGYKYLVKGHFFGKKEYGYGSCRDSAELTSRIKTMYEKMIIPYIKDGVCGCIYTQLSDVEGEINGLYTYDRAVCKVDKAVMKEIVGKIDVEINRVSSCGESGISTSNESVDNFSVDKKAVIRCSICTGEQVAGFKDEKTGKFTEVMLIRDDKDLKKFMKMYDLKNVEKIY